MRSRRTKGLLTIAALVGLAAIGANAARGSDTTAATRTEVAATSTRAAAAAASTATPKPDGAADQPPAGRSKSSAGTWAVTKVVDGDTIWVSRDGASRKVRFIGIDPPETDQCGFTEARNALRGLLGGQRVTLTAGAKTDVDRYGRLLRYVDVNGVDSGLRLIKQGYAVARYDSRDGYGAHARETAYVRADAASPKAACADPGTGNATSSSGVTGPWPQVGDKHPCPQARPVKGNEDSMIAHEPSDRYYNITKPEQCFATMSAAEAAGFRPAKI